MITKRIITTGVLLLLVFFELSVPDRELSQTVWGYSYLPEKQDWGFARFPRMSELEITEVFRTQLKGPISSLGMIEPRKLAHHLLTICDQYQFDPALILSLIHVESRFQPTVVSKAGAIGLLQLLPQTAVFISKGRNFKNLRRWDLRNPFNNISLGVAYLAFLRDRYSGSFKHLLMGYNLGHGAADKISAKKIKTTAQKEWILPPVVQTSGVFLYIRRVQERALEFRQLSFRQLSLKG